MRVTIEYGVYNLLEVRIESMFDNGKGRTIQRTDIFLVRVGMRGNLTCCWNEGLCMYVYAPYGNSQKSRGSIYN